MRTNEKKDGKSEGKSGKFHWTGEKKSDRRLGRIIKKNYNSIKSSKLTYKFELWPWCAPEYVDDGLTPRIRCLPFWSNLRNFPVGKVVRLPRYYWFSRETSPGEVAFVVPLNASISFSMNEKFSRRVGKISWNHRESILGYWKIVVSFLLF